ncbi:undecaprenyl-diphosphatase [Prosthecobacter fusiformis]|uniref:Undecaprenyl-diphosphatase n=1 Tax=Prosthecobacter fusiformis TaxID=48464 RepID=A0A4R7SQP3_9BACT|nr:phosphatase PAP2 family protein [Prosthecobacter fusiformis]TDU80995.1 undecaprenyl-diphosphatase [Prosthecobacter fusiformis]
MPWDLHLLQRINLHWTHPVLDWLMPAISAINAWVPLLALVVILVAWRGGRQGRLMLLCIGLAVGIGDGIVSNTLKKTVGRVRPRDAMSGLIVRDLGPGKPDFLRLFTTPVQSPSKPRRETRGKSFPSSHTVNMFALATVIALFHRRWGLLMYGLAASVAYSRLYVAAHWPSDIPPSAALGILIALATVWTVDRIRQRFSKQEMPLP